MSEVPLYLGFVVKARAVLMQYRDTSLIKKRAPLGPCRRPMPRVVRGS